MAQGSDQGSSGAGQHASWPSGGDAEADSPVAAATAGAAAAMTLGSVLTVGGILLLFVVFALGLASLQYCFDARSSRRRGPRRTAPAGGGGTRPRASRGVDPELLRSLPVTVYRAAAPPAGSKDDADADAAEVECAVCLAELQDGEETRFLPRCGHGFHADCVDTWLASHTTCPLCRLTVAKPDDGVSPPAAPPSSLALPPVAPEHANYAAAGASLPASVLLGVSGHGAVTATSDVVPPNPSSARPTAAMVIEIPESSVPTLTTPCDAAKSPGSARLRSIRRLLSFGRQGAAGGATSSCSCAGAGASDGVDMEKGIS